MALVPSAIHKHNSRERESAILFLQVTALPLGILKKMLQTLAIFAGEDQDGVIRIILRDVRIGVDLD